MRKTQGTKPDVSGDNRKSTKAELQKLLSPAKKGAG